MQQVVSERNLFEIPLKSAIEGILTFEYELNDIFFEGIENSEIRKGKVAAKVEMQKVGDCFRLQFLLKGFVMIVCDRCLDEMQQEIEYHDELTVRFGAEFLQEDDTVTVPEKAKSLDIRWFLYEFVVLGIPIIHSHPDGQCNSEMLAKLQKYLVTGKDNSLTENELEGKTDPRWDKLKNIII